jgi:hypothetical protein
MVDLVSKGVLRNWHDIVFHTFIEAHQYYRRAKFGLSRRKTSTRQRIGLARITPWRFEPSIADRGNVIGRGAIDLDGAQRDPIIRLDEVRTNCLAGIRRQSKRRLHYLTIQTTGVR